RPRRSTPSASPPRPSDRPTEPAWPRRCPGCPLARRSRIAPSRAVRAGAGRIRFPVDWTRVYRSRTPARRSRRGLLEPRELHRERDPLEREELPLDREMGLAAAEPVAAIAA